MSIKIIQKSNFTVVGYSKRFKNNEGYKECPKYWKEHYSLKRNEFVEGKFGICFSDDPKGKTFKYMIADPYFSTLEYPEDTEILVLSEGLWAVFSAVGPVPQNIHKTMDKIFNKWLVNNKQYKLRENYDIEVYTDPALYKNGMNDHHYYSEIWIPIDKI